MKVYESHVTAPYGGGMILIAADSAEEALKIASENADWDNLFYACKILEKRFVQFPDLSPEMSPFAEVPNLIYNGNEPKIILENIYIE